MVNEQRGFIAQDLEESIAVPGTGNVVVFAGDFENITLQTLMVYILFPPNPTNPG